MTNSLDLQQKSSQNAQQMQRLIMSPAMQQAVHLMQLPTLELAQFVETSLAQNPIIERTEENEGPGEEDEREEETLSSEKELDFNENDFSILQQLDQDFRECFEDTQSTRNSTEEKLHTFLEQSMCSQPSLFEHLMKEAQSFFGSSKERAIAEIIIGNLDENGFLSSSLDEMAKLNHIPEKKLLEVLNIIQTFDPYGVGARSLQECMLIQLRCWNKQDTLAAAIVEKHFDDLLHNRIPIIKKSLKCTSEEIMSAIKQDLSRLDLRPGACYLKRMGQPIVPDATIRQDGETFQVEINNDYIPGIRINSRYMRMASDEATTSDTKQFIFKHMNSAKWLLRNIQQRNETLERIVKNLSEKQKDFFSSPEGQLIPLTMGAVADELGLHESTIARAVANKYLQTPRGVFSLRSFFKNSYTTDQGKEISSNTVREVLQELINKEDKRRPLSDSILAEQLKEKGIPCARRTVAKYRTELNVGNAQQRRKF
jgi:RNA polymerase sigma-54 factor